MTRHEWAKVNKLSDIEQVTDNITRIVMSGQLGAAKDGAAMVGLALAEQGMSAPMNYQVVPEAFAGMAADGRSIGSLVQWSQQVAVNTPGTTRAKLDAAGNWLELVMHNEIADSGRVASGVGITARPRTGYYRMVSPPCCQNCAILAGQFYSHSSGFDRHPGCDCTHIPATEGHPVPEGYTGHITNDQINDLTEAQKKALEMGADRNQVINAYRDAVPWQRERMSYTTEGMSRRGVAKTARESYARRTGTGIYKGRRLTPERIYELVEDDREKAIKLLIREGYLVPTAA